MKNDAIQTLPLSFLSQITGGFAATRLAPQLRQATRACGCRGACKHGCGCTGPCTH